jgi:hypothetical protein
MTGGAGDARFEDGGEAPLRLRALDADDLGVISALVQDAVFPGSEMSWQPRRRRFALLLNRFRWEDRDAAQAQRRPVERVRSVLAVEDVAGVRSQGVARADDRVYSLLSLDWQPGEDGTGQILMTLAETGALALQVEALEVTLHDVTRPYLDPARRAPDHG